MDHKAMSNFGEQLEEAEETVTRAKHTILSEAQEVMRLTDRNQMLNYLSDARQAGQSVSLFLAKVTRVTVGGEPTSPRGFFFKDPDCYMSGEYGPAGATKPYKMKANPVTHVTLGGLSQAKAVDMDDMDSSKYTDEDATLVGNLMTSPRIFHYSSKLRKEQVNRMINNYLDKEEEEVAVPPMWYSHFQGDLAYIFDQATGKVRKAKLSAQYNPPTGLLRTTELKPSASIFQPVTAPVRNNIWGKVNAPDEDDDEKYDREVAEFAKKANISLDTTEPNAQTIKLVKDFLQKQKDKKEVTFAGPTTSSGVVYTSGVFKPPQRQLEHSSFYGAGQATGFKQPQQHAQQQQQQQLHQQPQQPMPHQQLSNQHQQPAYTQPQVSTASVSQTIETEGVMGFRNYDDLYRALSTNTVTSTAFGTVLSTLGLSITTTSENTLAKLVANQARTTGNYFDLRCFDTLPYPTALTNQLTPSKAGLLVAVAFVKSRLGAVMAKTPFGISFR